MGLGPGAALSDSLPSLNNWADLDLPESETLMKRDEGDGNPFLSAPVPQTTSS